MKTSVDCLGQKQHGWGDKRQSLPFIIKSDCPACGCTATRDLSEECGSIFQPGWGKPQDLLMECWTDGCKSEWDVTVVVSVYYTLELKE